MMLPAGNWLADMDKHLKGPPIPRGIAKILRKARAGLIGNATLSIQSPWGTAGSEVWPIKEVTAV